MPLAMFHPVFPTPDIDRTSAFYRERLGFVAVEYLDAEEPHVCLYRDGVEVILTRTGNRVVPVRDLYGYGYDAYLIGSDLPALAQEFAAAGVTIVRPLATTDYHSEEFVIEDCDGRWLGIGIKE